jgi:tRNA(adenine34) deaminase
MLTALKLANLALEEGNMPVGSVIIHDGLVIASGKNTIDSGRDDTHHAELVAIQQAAPFLFIHKGQCTIYTTLEPCMMCLGAIINVGINRIIFAAPDPLVGAASLLSAIQYYRAKGVQLLGDVMRTESQALLDEYVKRTGFRRHLASNAKA